MAGCNAAFDKGRATRQAQGRLCNVAVRLGQHHLAEFLDLGFCGCRPHQHAVTACAMHLLDHQVFQVRQRVGQVVRFAALVGRDVVEQGFFAEVKLNHLGHKGINRLVVRHPGTDRVADRHMAAAVGLHQPGAAQCGAGTKGLGVQKVVVHAPVNHVHAARPTRGAHENELVLHKQVLPFHQFHAHLLGQKSVFKIGAVVHAGGQHHHGGFCRGGGAGVTQGFEQQVRVVRNRRHAVHVEEFGEQPHHHLAVFQHVTHTAGHTQVVFQHVKLAHTVCIGGPHNVDAGNLRIDVARHRDADHLGPELGVLQDLLSRDHPGLDDFLAVVHVVQEMVQRCDALHQALLHGGPFVGGQHARDQVKRNQALGAGIVFPLGPIHGKGDADAPEDQFGLLAPSGHHVTGLARQPPVVSFVVVADQRAV